MTQLSRRNSTTEASKKRKGVSTFTLNLCLAFDVVAVIMCVRLRVKNEVILSQSIHVVPNA